MVPALFVTAPHASAELPEWLTSRLAVPKESLAEAVDPGTAEVAAALGAEAVQLGEVSRLVCDLDQELPDDNRPDRRFSVEDARGRALWVEPLSWTERERLVREVYRPWYQQARDTREGLIRRFGRLAHLDLNAWRLADSPEGQAQRDQPLLMLANGGYPDTAEGERVSCAPPVVRALAAQLSAAFSTPVGINQRFKGGGVIRTFGHHPGSTLQLTWQARLVCGPDERGPDPTLTAAFAATLHSAVRAWLHGLMTR